VVGPQVEYDPFFDFIYIADTTITLGNNTRNCVGGFCPVSGVGPFGNFFRLQAYRQSEFNLADRRRRHFASTIAGFSTADIEFSENEIFLRFERLRRFALGNIISPGEAVLNVTFAMIPEPGALALFCAGLAGLIRGQRRVAPKRPGRLGYGPPSV